MEVLGGETGGWSPSPRYIYTYTYTYIYTYIHTHTTHIIGSGIFTVLLKVSVVADMHKRTYVKLHVKLRAGGSGTGES